MTAMTTVATMAADAGTTTQSSLRALPTPSVRISLHCSWGTVPGVIRTSSRLTTHTTMHSLAGTFLMRNSRSLGASGGPCLKSGFPNSLENKLKKCLHVLWNTRRFTYLYTTLNPSMLDVSDSHLMTMDVSSLYASLTMTSSGGEEDCFDFDLDPPPPFFDEEEETTGDSLGSCCPPPTPTDPPWRWSRTRSPWTGRRARSERRLKWQKNNYKTPISISVRFPTYRGADTAGLCCCGGGGGGGGGALCLLLLLLLLLPPPLL